MLWAVKLVIWHPNRSIFRGVTFQAKRMNTNEYRHRAVVIVPEMIFGSFLMSARAAIGMPQLATGPQKWVLIRYSRNSLLFKLSISFLPMAAAISPSDLRADYRITFRGGNITDRYLRPATGVRMVDGMVRVCVRQLDKQFRWRVSAWEMGLREGFRSKFRCLSHPR